MRIPFAEVFDIFALRIIIDTPRDREKQACWAVYSIVTDFYTPNPDRMRDWISIPKSNGYESLHTTVVTKDGQWVEIQIRSERMDAVAERGIAAHWRYKGVNQGGMGSEEWLGRLREMMETTHASKIAETFGEKMSSREIFVFTPNGDLRKLPEGATVLDFAFDIHSTLGASCTGARIKGRNVPIKEKLHNGDIVEILTSKNQRPKADWLAFVTTGKARSKIRAALRELSAQTANLGREELERKLKNWKLPMEMDEAVTRLCKHFRYKTGTELYGRIASGEPDLGQIKEILAQPDAGPIIPEPSSKAIKTQDAAPDALVIEDGLSGLDYKLARCCNPIFGDEVFAFVTVTAGITIHRHDCPNGRRLREQYPYRVLPARWSGSRAAAGGFLVSISVTADDVTGMVNRITEVIAELKLGIRSMNVSSAAGVLRGVINIEVGSTGIVDTLLYSILRIKGVQKAFRLNK
jgi:GTP pyrophosphokinase